MLNIETLEQLKQLLESQPAVLLLFGGEHCGVCQALKPRISAMLADEYPLLQAAYIDCQGPGQQLSAQMSIFSLPVVQVYFDGEKFAELQRVFSLADLREAIDRPYRLSFEEF
ncbi:thioredoxin family protein [Shewanella algae]|uniref:thioredoxin family protein n=1 Tax=Shewanella algae TaxID=38313 RepID=UPI00222ED2E7|nr:thioredoxin family protein [Shewanella algae]UZD59741.1 thioredoxin family protein [Shewanella algae]